MSTRPQISKAFVRSHQEARMEIACAEAAMEKGTVHAVIVSDIVSHAKCARNIFYEVFRSKEDCAQAALGTTFDDALIATHAKGVEGLLEFIALNPALARLALFDGVMLPAMAEVYSYGLTRFEALLREKFPEPPNPEVYAMLVGGVEAMLKRQFREDLAGIVGLRDEIEQFVAAPFKVAAC